MKSVRLLGEGSSYILEGGGRRAGDRAGSHEGGMSANGMACECAARREGVWDGYVTPARRRYHR
jgi:hypothetical protein